MPVRVLTDNEKDALNSVPGVIGENALGSNLQNMQVAINSGGGGSISGAANVGTGSGQVFKQVSAGLIELRKILAGTNMTVTQIGDDISLDASASGSSDYVFWPSAPVETGQVFKVWTNLMAAIAALPSGVQPKVTFKENFTIPAGTWDFRLGLWDSPVIATGAVSIIVPDGVVLDNWLGTENGLLVEFQPSTSYGALTNTLLGGLVIVIESLGSKIANTGAGAIVNASSQVVWVRNNSTNTGVSPTSTGALVNMTNANTILAILFGESPNTGWEDGCFTGGIAGAQLLFIHGVHFNMPVLTWGGDPILEINDSQAKNLVYDDAAQAPASGSSTTQGVIDWLKTQIFGGAFTNLSDVPASYVGEGGKLVKVNVGETGLEFVAGGGGVTNFTDLADVPANYTGASLQSVRVNVGETGLEFFTGAGGADQYEIVFDPAAAVETDNLKNTFDTLMQRVAVLSPQNVRVVVRKPGINQIVTVPTTGMPLLGWDLEKISFVCAPDSPGIMLDFVDGTIIQNMHSAADGVIFRFNATTVPVCSITGAKVIGLDSAGFYNNGSQPIFQINGGFLYFLVNGIYSPISKFGSAESVDIQTGSMQIDIVTQTLTNGLLSTNDQISGPGGAVTYNIYTLIPGGFTQTNANYSGTTTVNMQAETRVNELISNASGSGNLAIGDFTFTAGVDPSGLGNARYHWQKVNKRVFVTVEFEFSSAGTAVDEVTLATLGSTYGLPPLDTGLNVSEINAHAYSDTRAAFDALIGTAAAPEVYFLIRVNSAGIMPNAYRSSFSYPTL